jgi:hypothetical protein
MNRATRHAYQRHLAILEQQAAYLGILTPPYIIMQIKDIEGRLKKDSEFISVNFSSE